MGIHDTLKDLPPDQQAKALDAFKERAKMPSLKTLAEGRSVFDGTIHDQMAREGAPKEKAKPVEVAKAVLAQAEAKPPRVTKKGAVRTQHGQHTQQSVRSEGGIRSDDADLDAIKDPVERRKAKERQRQKRLRDAKKAKP